VIGDDERPSEAEEMKARGSQSLVIVLCAVACACNNPAAPASAAYSGQWSGTTVQGKSIAFTISSDELVTAITLEHDFNGCSGSQMLANLSQKIAPNVTCIPAPCPASVLSYRAFGYATGNPVEGPSTEIHGLFLSTTRAEGTVNFRNFPGCGSAIGVAWSASRR
jgi:hypothetical protein